MATKKKTSKAKQVKKGDMKKLAANALAAQTILNPQTVKKGRVPTAKFNKLNKWKPEYDQAAALVAEGKLKLHRIAEKLDIPIGTLRLLYRESPEFNEKVNANQAAFASKIEREFLATKLGRVRKLINLHEGLEDVIEQRAEQYKNQKLGGSTGLVVKKTKAVGTGRYATLVKEFEVDTTTIKEMRQIQEQIARELGQWQQTESNQNVVIIREYSGVDTSLI